MTTIKLNERLTVDQIMELIKKQYTIKEQLTEELSKRKDYFDSKDVLEKRMAKDRRIRNLRLMLPRVKEVKEILEKSHIDNGYDIDKEFIEIYNSGKIKKFISCPTGIDYIPHFEKETEIVIKGVVGNAFYKTNYGGLRRIDNFRYLEVEGDICRLYVDCEKGN